VVLGGRPNSKLKSNTYILHTFANKTTELAYLLTFRCSLNIPFQIICVFNHYLFAHSIRVHPLPLFDSDWPPTSGRGGVGCINPPNTFIHCMGINIPRDDGNYVKQDFPHFRALVNAVTRLNSDESSGYYFESRRYSVREREISPRPLFGYVTYARMTSRTHILRLVDTRTNNNIVNVTLRNLALRNTRNLLDRKLTSSHPQIASSS